METAVLIEMFRSRCYFVHDVVRSISVLRSNADGFIYENRSLSTRNSAIGFLRSSLVASFVDSNETERTTFRLRNSRSCLVQRRSRFVTNSTESDRRIEQCFSIKTEQRRRRCYCSEFSIEMGKFVFFSVSFLFCIYFTRLEKYTQKTNTPAKHRSYRCSTYLSTFRRKTKLAAMKNASKFSSTFI